MVAFDPFGSGPSSEEEVQKITGKTSDQIINQTRQGHRQRLQDFHAQRALSQEHTPGQWGVTRKRRAGNGY